MVELPSDEVRIPLAPVDLAGLPVGQRVIDDSGEIYRMTRGRHLVDEGGTLVDPDGLEGCKLYDPPSGRTFLTLDELNALDEDASVTSGQVWWSHMGGGMYRESESGAPNFSEFLDHYGVWESDAESTDAA